jgi:hypothetical protein
MKITELLLARIEEDEAASQQPRGRHWTTNSCYEIEDENGKCVLEVGFEGGYDFEGNVIEHFARHDPSRVLAECAAKRAILAGRKRSDSSMADDEWSMGWSDANYDALHALAAVYKDHPDWRPEWAL